jgi:hypothetical protein
MVGGGGEGKKQITTVVYSRASVSAVYRGPKKKLEKEINGS